jgi:Domain of unknown function (DUF4268)
MTGGLDGPTLGRLERVDPRGVWSNEEREFTPWLLANTDYLSEALGIDVGLDVAEHRVGPFELDLLGSDLTDGTTLIIENQLEQTDHDHLGKLLTYAAGTDAATVIWIATRFTEQHRQAVTWLNERTGEETKFFGVELELVRIGASDPAPNFKIVAAPNEWQKKARDASRARRAATGKGAAYAEFWAKLVERVTRERPSWTRRRNLTGNTANWIDMPCPSVPLAWFSLNFASQSRLQHGLYVGGGSGEQNLAVFQALRDVRETLVREYGRQLEFEERPGQKACRVADYTEGDVTRIDEHEQYLDWFMDAGDRLRRALAAVGSIEPVERLTTNADVDQQGPPPTVPVTDR